jgi:hypothetical protein
MNFKTFLFLFIIGTLVSCACHRDKPVSSEEPVIFPDNGRGCCD